MAEKPTGHGTKSDRTWTTIGYKETPLWWDEADYPVASAAVLPRQADVVIIGAGYTGLTAALQLGKRGVQALVLDGELLGRGASGRNAGMVHGGVRRDIEWLERRYGAPGKALHEASVEAHRFVAELARDVAPDSDYRDSGWLYLAHRKSRMRNLRAQERIRRERLGETTRLLSIAEMERETRASGLYGGLLTSNGGSLHPGRYLAGLARAVIAGGTHVHDRCVVTEVASRRGSAGITVSTSMGPVVTRDLLAATNGYTDRALPQLRRRIIPIGSYIIATEPLAEALEMEISPQRRVMSDTRDFLHYWRMTSDHRLLFGGRTSFAPVSLQKARDRLYADMIGMYPQLAGVQITHAWTGNVGFTFDRVPHLGRRDGITYAMGYCGSGVAMASWLGTLAGRWIADGDDAQMPPFAALKFPTKPGYTGNPWFLPIVGLYYQLRDRFS